jgi:hypothetical protein
MTLSTVKCRNRQTDRRDKNFYKEDHRDTPPLRRFKFHNQRQSETNRPQGEDRFIRVTPFRRYSTPRYQNMFFGLCYACNKFGHKVVNFIANSRNINNFEIHTENGYLRSPSETQRIIYNNFESLSTEAECYK